MRSAPTIRVTPRLDRLAFREIRREMELSHFKWDPQVGDTTAIAPFALVVSTSTWNELANAAERLTRETLAIEDELWHRRELHAPLAVPRTLRDVLGRGSPSPSAARIMRFDFHPTRDGWRVSEVNSDVPGGFSEATWLPRLFAPHVSGVRSPGDPTRAVLDAIAPGGTERTVALTSAPGHIEDHQVVLHLASELRSRSHTSHLVAPGQIEWIGREAYVRVASQLRRIDAIFRFYQSEWLASLPSRIGWRTMFSDGLTPIANPGIAALTESKRLPLVWDALHMAVPTWRAFLPETRDLREVSWPLGGEWVLKSAYSNTGDSVMMRSTMTRLEWHARTVAARARRGEWIAQRHFDTVSLESEGERFFPCIGVYTVDGTAAGVYARVSTSRVIDGAARDVPFFVEGAS